MLENGPTSKLFHPQLPTSARKKVARAAHITVSLHTLPLSFYVGHHGLKKFDTVIFEMGHTMPGSKK